MAARPEIKSYLLDGISVLIFPDKVSLGIAAANQVSAGIRHAIASYSRASIIFATGASQYEFLEALIHIPDLDWPAVTAFHLDEYLGMADTHPASFRRYLRERLFDHIPVGTVHLIEGDAPDPVQETQRYGSLLKAHRIDIACIGIGENGHLAFNDPPADFTTTELVHIVTLDMACRRQQCSEGFFPELNLVPRTAFSLSIPAILSAQEISCVVPDLRKAEAVRNALLGPITPDCPASALRMHKNVRLYLDPESSSLLGL